MLSNKDMLAFTDELFSGFRVEITVHTVLFLPETLFSFLQVVRDAALCKKRLRFLLIVLFGCLKERGLQVLLVNIEGGFVDVGFVQAKRDEGIDNFLDKTLIDGLAIPLALD